MAKKPWVMNQKEIGDALEERTAKYLDGRRQVGSGSVRVPFLRGDVISPPFMIECKATKEDKITLKEDVWTDLKGKTKQTTYSPAYALSTVDKLGNFYDVVGIPITMFTDSLLKVVCPNGMLQHYDVKKTKVMQYIQEAVKTKKYISVHFTNLNDTLIFVPLIELSKHYDKLVEGLR